MRKIPIHLYLISWLISYPAFGATVSCDGTQSDCQAKIIAASTGDTIQWPLNGSFTWTSGISIDKPITLDGNGSSLTQSGVLSYGFVRITGFISDDLVRVTGFTFNGVEARNSPQVVVDSVTLTSLRIDHNTLRKGNYPLTVGGAYGVIDNNSLYNCNGWADFSAGTRTQADDSWRDLTAGTANALFYEDNKHYITGNYDAGNALDAEQGGKFVYRYNTFDYSESTYDGPQGTFSLHGSASGGCGTGFDGAGYWQYDEASTKCVRRSPSLVEIYNNTMSGARIDAIVGFRGGSFLIHDNIHSDSYGGTAVIRLTEEEFRTDEDGQWQPTRSAFPGEDHINNTFIWNNIRDGGSQLTIDNISVLDFNSYCTSNGAPITCCTGLGTGTCNLGEANAIIKENRDFFLHAPQATGGSESWTCEDGITNCNGASGSYPTDGDTITTYGTMVFTASGANKYYPYTPYTYPHPLRGETGDITPPVISSPSPSGSQTCTSNPRNVTLQVTTDENATCRYGTSDLAYASLSNTFTTTGTTAHSQIVSNDCGSSYLYYVRCQDGTGNANASSTQISYSVAAAPAVAGYLPWARVQ